MRQLRTFKSKTTGTVITEEKNNDAAYLNLFALIAEHPDWMDITPDTYRIVSLKNLKGLEGIMTFNHKGICIERNDGISPKGTNELDKCLDSGHSVIHSVERLEDGEVFTVNDRVSATDNIFTDNSWHKDTLSEDKSGTWDSRFDDTTITGFKVVEGRMCAIYAAMGGDCGQPIEFVKKFKEPILVTKDGVNLFNGDSYYFIWLNKPAKGQSINTIYKVDAINLGSEETFSTEAVFFAKKESAEEWLIMNTPLLSLSDLLEEWGTTADKDFYADSLLFKKFIRAAKNKL